MLLVLWRCRLVWFVTRSRGWANLAHTSQPHAFKHLVNTYTRITHTAEFRPDLTDTTRSTWWTPCCVLPHSVWFEASPLGDWVSASLHRFFFVFCAKMGATCAGAFSEVAGQSFMCHCNWRSNSFDLKKTTSFIHEIRMRGGDIKTNCSTKHVHAHRHHVTTIHGGRSLL